MFLSRTLLILCAVSALSLNDAYIQRQMSTLNNNKISYFAPRAPNYVRTASVRKRQSAARTLSRTTSQMLVTAKKNEMIEGSIEINAPAMDVYKIATDFKEFPKWADGIKSVQIPNPKNGNKPPEIVKFDMSMFGLHHLNTMKYEYDPGRKMSWTMTDGGVKSLNGNYDFKPLPNGHTLVTFHLDVDPGFPVPHMLKRMSTKAVVSSAVKGLKDFTESHLPEKHDLRPGGSRRFPAFSYSSVGHFL